MLIVIRLVIVLLKVLQFVLVSAPEVEPDVVPSNRVLSLRKSLLAVPIVIELVAILLKVVQSILVSTPVVKPDAVPRENIVPLTESPLVAPMLLSWWMYYRRLFHHLMRVHQ